MKAEKIFYNGTIITMDESQKIVEAVAVEKNYIVACGNLQDVKSIADDKTQYIDLKGKTMLPGFIDGHSHFLETAERDFWVDLNSPPVGNVNCIDDIIALLKEKAKNTPKGEWVIGWGYDDTLLKEMRHPTRQDLDKVSLEHPIVLQHRTGWVSTANSLALKIGGIDRNTEDVSTLHAIKDEHGEPTGVLETSLCPVMAQIPAIDEESYIQGIENVARTYLSKGCTTAQEGWLVYPERLEWVKNAREQDRLNIRLMLWPVAEGKQYENNKKQFPDYKSGKTIDPEQKITMGAYKLTADGSIQVLTAYLGQPYLTPPSGAKADYCGYPTHDDAWLEQRIDELHAEGKQIAVHCNGDAAIEVVLNAFEKALKRNPKEDHRFIIVHCQTVRPDQLERIARLNIICSFFVTHTYFYGDRHYNVFLGPERALRINPLKEAQANNIIFSLHNDTYVTPIDPLLSVWSAVNRQSLAGNDLGKEAQGIDVYSALKAITIDGAYQGYEEDIKGSIAVGKLADFAILEENPLEIEPLKIKDIKVLEAIVGGKSVFSL